MFQLAGFTVSAGWFHCFSWLASMFQLACFTVSAGRLPGLHVDLQRGVLPARRLRHSHLGVQLPVQPRLLHARLPL